MSIKIMRIFILCILVCFSLTACGYPITASATPESSPSLSPTTEQITTTLPTIIKINTNTPSPTPLCNDQDPGDLSDPGNPAEPTRFDSPDIAGVLNERVEDFDIFKHNMHNRLVTVAIEKDFEMETMTSEEFSEFIFNTWALYWKEFGGFPYESYTLVIGNNLPYGDISAYGTGFQGAHPRTDWISHEMFHAWSGNAFRQADDQMWFMEGVTVYYGNIRQQVQYPYQSILSSFYNEYLNFGPEPEKPLGEMKQNDPDYDHGFVGHKGALLAYLLDVELMKYGHNLGDVMQLVYQRYGISSKGMPTNDELLSIFNEVSGADFSSLFNDYVYGSKRIQLDGYDFEWVCHK